MLFLCPEKRKGGGDDNERDGDFVSAGSKKRVYETKFSAPCLLEEQEQCGLMEWKDCPASCRRDKIFLSDGGNFLASTFRYESSLSGSFSGRYGTVILPTVSVVICTE